MKHWGRWRCRGVAWSFPVLHCPFLLGAVGRGPLVLEGDVVRLTKEASGLSRMETLEQAISSMSKRTGPVQSDLRFRRAQRRATSKCSE